MHLNGRNSFPQACMCWQTCGAGGVAPLLAGATSALPVRCAHVRACESDHMHAAAVLFGYGCISAANDVRFGMHVRRIERCICYPPVC